MRATPLTLAAAAAGAANAFLIPSTNSAPGVTEVDALNLKAFGVDPKEQLLKAPCAGCKFATHATSDNSLVWTKGIENALVLNVSVGAQVGTLELNGVRFYPPVMNFAAENPAPYIPQIPAEMTLVEVRNSMESLQQQALRLTSWSFQAGPSSTVDENGDELLTIHLQLDALEREPINVPDVAITALKTSEGELSIVKVVLGDREEAEKEECEMWPVMCKLKEIIAGVKGMKPHFGLPSFGKPADCESQDKTASGTSVDANGDWIPGSGPPPWITGDKDYKGWKPGQGTPPPWVKHGEHGHQGWKGHHGPPGEHPHGPPHHDEGDHEGWKPGQGPPPWVKHGWKHGHGPHGHGPHGHMRHGGFHRAMHIFGRVMLTVLVPILLGIAAGMVTYLLGMIFGAVIVAIYMKIRGRREKYSRVALEEEVAEFEIDDEETPRNSFDEKDQLLESPPEYVEKE